MTMQLQPDEYKHQLNRLRAALQPALERFERGEHAFEVDVDQLVDDVLRNGPRASGHQ